jgi:hypothetical protein
LKTIRPSAEIFISPEPNSAKLWSFIERKVDGIIMSLPDPENLPVEQRRRIIARYTAVLEGNFIYWMTATYLSLSSPGAQTIVKKNLEDEIRENHPGMLRRFALAAKAVPTKADYLAIHERLASVRNFVAGMRAFELLLMMAFFEGFIARFMPFFARLAGGLGSVECEYTDVHSAVDMRHSQELTAAFDWEALRGGGAASCATKGIDLLERLLEIVIEPNTP